MIAALFGFLRHLIQMKGIVVNRYNINRIDIQYLFCL